MSNNLQIMRRCIIVAMLIFGMPFHVATAPSLHQIAFEKNKKEIQKNSSLIEKMKKYITEDRAKDYAIKGLGLLGVIFGIKLGMYYTQFYYFKEKKIGESPCHVIAYGSSEQIKVNEQIGCMCGFHAGKNGILIAKNLLHNLDTLSSDLMEERDDLFVSNSQSIYPKDRGKWRNEIEQTRNENHNSEWIDDIEMVKIIHLAEQEFNMACQMEYAPMIVYDPATLLRGRSRPRVCGRFELQENINQFREDATKLVLPIIINQNDKHWFVMVLWKRTHDSISSIIADSKNWVQLYNPAVKDVIDVVNGEKLVDLNDPFIKGFLIESIGI